MSWGLRILVPAIAACGACTGTAARASDASCALAPADSVYLAGGPVYRACAVDQRARLVRRGRRPDFRDLDPPLRESCYKVEVEFVVDARGSPELDTPQVVHTNNSRFAEAVLATLASWQYAPARKNGVAVRQIVRETQSAAVVVVVSGRQTPRGGRPPVC